MTTGVVQYVVCVPLFRFHYFSFIIAWCLFCHEKWGGAKKCSSFQSLIQLLDLLLNSVCFMAQSCSGAGQESCNVVCLSYAALYIKLFPCE